MNLRRCIGICMEEWDYEFEAVYRDMYGRVGGEKITKQSEMARNAIQSDFQTSKMAAGKK